MNNTFVKYLLLISCLIALFACPHGSTHLNGDIDALVQKGMGVAERKKNQKETFTSSDYHSEVVGLLRYVPGGKYEKAVTVEIHSFCMAETEVTQKAWIEVMGDKPSLIVDEPKTSGDQPVNGISLFDAMKFCNQLSIKEGLELVYYWNSQGEKITHPDSWPEDLTQIQIDRGRSGYRLPTVDEFLWASMGAHRSRGYPNYGIQEEGWSGKEFSGATPGKNHSMGDYAWYQGNSGGKLQPVKQRKPNEIGLYDLSGNASEWVHSHSNGYAIAGGAFSDQESQLALRFNPKQVTSFSESLMIETVENQEDQDLWTWQADGEADLSKPQGVVVTLKSPARMGELTLKATNAELSDVEIQIEEMQLITQNELKDKPLSGRVTGAAWENRQWILKQDGEVELTTELTHEGNWDWTGEWVFGGSRISSSSWEFSIDWRGSLAIIIQDLKAAGSQQNGTGSGSGEKDETGLIIRGSTWKLSKEKSPWWEGILQSQDLGSTGVGATWTGTLIGKKSVTETIKTIIAQKDIEIGLKKGVIEKANLAAATLTVENKTFIAQLPGLSLKKNESTGRLEASGKIKVTAPGFRVVRKPPR